MHKLLPQTGGIIWLTGLSGSGKSTIAAELNRRLRSEGRSVVMLDGDDLRGGLCSDLGFGRQDRSENVRRAAELAALVGRSGLVCLVALIAPFAADRLTARAIAERRRVRFLEVFVDAPVEVCERRDPKGLYKLARSGCIAQFTGLSDPYEPPEGPDVHIRTDLLELEQCISRILDVAQRRMGP